MSQPVSRHLFLATTPYHVLLSCTLAGELAAPCERRLLVLPTFSEADALLDAVRAQGYFESIEALPYASGSSYGGIRIASAHIRQSVSACGPLHAVYVCNDRNPVMQAALDAARRMAPGVRITYVEDGTAAYVAKRHTADILGLSTLGERLAYGPWYQHLRCLGTSRWIDALRATFPTYIRPELRRLPTHPIDASAFLRVITDAWTDQYLETQGMTRDALRAFDMLFIAPHSRMTRDAGGYLEFVGALIGEARQRGACVAVKYHPREPSGDYLQARSLGCATVPHGIPAELLFVRADVPGPLIVGDISTALVTARWLLPHSTVVSLADQLGIRDAHLTSFLRDIGVHFPPSVGEALAYHYGMSDRRVGAAV